MRVYIPKRYESKLALREFIQSREFIMGMKQALTKQMLNCINHSNNLADLMNQK